MLAIKLDITTIADGSVTVTVGLNSAPRAVYAVEWAVGTLATGVDAVISATGTTSGVDATLLTLTNADANATYYPRVLESDNAGAALTTRTYPIADGDLKVVVTSGGNAKTGAVVVYLLE